MKGPRRQKNFRFALRVAVLLANGLGLIFICLVLLTAGTTYFLLPRMIDSTRVKSILTQRLEEILHRPVSIGDMILAPQGVKITAVTIANASAQDGALVDGGSAVISIKIMPLLRRRLDIKSIRLINPRIRLVRDAQGLWTFADLFKPRALPKSDANPFFFAMPVSFKAQRFSVENGTLIIDDTFKRRTFMFKNMTLSAERPGIMRPFAFSASFDDDFPLGDRTIAASCAFSGSIFPAGLDLSSASIVASRLVIRSAGETFAGSARISGFPKPLLEGRMQSPALDGDWFKTEFGRRIPPSWPQSRWAFQARFDSPRQIRVRRLAMDSELFSARAVGRLDFSSAPWQMSASIVLSTAPIENFSFLIPEISERKMRGTALGKIRIMGPWNHLRVFGAQARLGNFSMTSKPFILKAGIASIAAVGGFSDIRAVVGGGFVSAIGHSASNVSFRARLLRHRLSFNALSLNWEGTRVLARGSIDNIARPSRVFLRADAGTLRWEKAQKLAVDVAAYLSRVKKARAKTPVPSPERHWLAFFKYHIPRRFPATSGRIVIGEVRHQNFWFKNASILWDLRGITPRLDNAAGEVRLGFGPGHISDLKSIAGSSKFMEIVFLPYTFMSRMNSFSVLSAAKAYPETFDFKRIEGQYSISKGLVRTRFFHVDSPQIIAFAQGSADFAKETVDMEVLTRLTHYDAPLPEWWVDELGRPAIGFWVKGNLEKPSIDPRLQKMGADEIERALAKAEARARERLKNTR
ncbi:MAG: DUF748 domain-containing protein [Elusimicrobiota bacterium]